MTMLPSRKVGVAFVGVFLVGAVVGGLIDSTFHDMRFSQFMSRTGDPKSMAAHINQKYVDEYHLSADEQARIAPLTQAMSQRLYVVRRQFGVDIMAAIDEYHGKIAEQMTPEHRAAYQAASVDRRKRMSAMLLLDQPGSSADGK
jgi:hypothetical protein